MTPQILGEDAKNQDPAKHLIYFECPEMVTLTRLHHEARIPWVQIIYNHLETITRTKVVTPSMQDNIYKILGYIGIPVRMFSINFRSEQYN